MRINNNIMAMNTHRQYAINNDNLAKATQRLSSGYRINNAADDAAGLAISEKMRAQIRGLNMAAKNSQDAISLVQTAEGALEETESILQRMRELAVQSASDTNQQIDRDALDAEFQQLIKELDDIANKADFNGTRLLNGDLSVLKFADIAADNETALTFKNGISLKGFENLEAKQNYTFDYAQVSAATGGGAGGTDPIPAKITFSVDGTTYYIESTPGEKFAKGTYKVLTDDAGGNPVDTGATIELSEEVATLLDVADPDTVDLSAVKLDIRPNAPITIQTGSNEGDTLSIEIGNMSSKGLGVAASSINSRENAAAAITTVGDAINKVSTQRAHLGAMQNRLEHKINNLNTSAENLQAAESRIRDIDMAKEMTQFTQTSILVQAATSMLAQANNAPQNVLSLLR